MKQLITLFILSFLFIQNSFACAPFFEGELMVANYNKSYKEKMPEGYYFNEIKEKQFVEFSDISRVFPREGLSDGKYFFTRDEINLESYKKGDQIIMISSYSNGDFEEYFGVYEIAKLSCNDDGKIQITDQQGIMKKWGKNLWQCGNYRPDDVMNEEELLKIVEEKYNFCLENQIPTITQEENITVNISKEKDIEIKGKIGIEKQAKKVNPWIYIVIFIVLIAFGIFGYCNYKNNMIK